MYITKVNTDETIIFQLGRFTSEYTFRSSITINAEKVIVTMFVKGSLKKTTEANMITQPWKIDFHSQIRKVLVERDRPFWRVL